MKDKRVDELYQYIEEHEEKWRIDHLKRYEYEDRINKVIEYFKYQLKYLDFEKDIKARMLCSMGIVLLKGDDNNAI